MNTENIYRNLDHHTPFIQSFASGLTKDFDVARFLYQETAHLAIKNKEALKEETLKRWLINTMRRIYSKVPQKNQRLLHLAAV